MIPILIGAVAALFLAGCATTAELEQRQLRGEACTFGGVTERAVLACAEHNFGTQGMLYAINEQASALAADCNDHVRLVGELLGGRYRVWPMRSCPPQSADCHVSAAVDTGKAIYILDNGVLSYPGSILTEAEFAAWIDPSETSPTLSAR